MIGKLLCKLFGHKRGKKVSGMGLDDGTLFRSYACPRCAATWTRKVRRAAA